MAKDRSFANLPILCKRGISFRHTFALRGVCWLALAGACGALATPVSANSQGEEALPANVLVRIGTDRFRHASTVEFLALLPDGKKLVSASMDHEVCLWDISRGHRLWSLRLASDERHFVLSPDGKTLASNNVRQIFFRDTATGRVRHQFPGQGTYHCMAFSPDSKLIASGGWDEKLNIWDAATGNLLKTTKFRDKRSIETLAISNDGKRVVGCTYSYRSPIELNVWEMAAPKQGLLADVKGDGLRVLCFSPDDTLLALGRGGQIVLRDSVQGKEVRVLNGHTKRVTGFAFTPDGKTLISSSEDGTTRFWDITSGKEVRKLHKHARDIRAMSLSADGKILATGGTDLRIRLWDTATGKELYADDFPCGFEHVLYSPDSKRLFTSDPYDTAIRIWDCTTGKEVSRIEKVAPDREGMLTIENPGGKGVILMGPPTVGRMVLSPNGTTMATFRSDTHIRFWDVATGKSRLMRGTWPPDYVAFSSDGQTLLTFDGHLRLWDVTSFKRRQEYKIADSSSISFAFCPKTMTYATHIGLFNRPEMRVVRLWDAVTGKELARLANEWDEVTHMKFSDDGWMLAVRALPLGGGGRQAKVLDVVTGEQMMVFPGYGTLSLDGRLFAGDGADNHGKDDPYLRIWDVVSGEERAEWTTGGGNISSVVFSPDGKKLVTVMTTGSLLLWDLTKLPPAKHLPKVEPLTANRFKVLWEALGNTEKLFGTVAHLYELTAGGEAAVALLKARLRPAESPDLKWVRQQIEQLGQDNAQTRAAALKELERVAGTVEPLLRQALDDDPSPTLREGLETLLKTKWFVRSPDMLRAVRGIQVLERIGTPQARAVLLQMAKGWPLAHETRYARQALLPMP